MSTALVSLAGWALLVCCQGPPADGPRVELVGQIAIDGIEIGGIEIGGQPTGALTIAADDPRLPRLKELGVVKRGPARAWGCEQATGSPDTEGAGDFRTAWASATPDEQDEWLELTFAAAVKPVEIHVVETYNPGALFKVTAATGDMEAVLWRGDDPTARDAERGTSIVKASAALKTNRIRIHLASKDVPGWNEIDAVGVKDEAGQMHWPISAVASSSYASGPEPGWMLDPSAALQRIEVLEREVQQLQKQLAKP